MHWLLTREMKAIVHLGKIAFFVYGYKSKWKKITGTVD